MEAAAGAGAHGSVASVAAAGTRNQFAVLCHHSGAGTCKEERTCVSVNAFLQQFFHLRSARNDKVVRKRTECQMSSVICISMTENETGWH